MSEELLVTRKAKEQFVFGSILLLSNKLQIIGDRFMEEISLKQWFLLIMIKKMPKANPSVTEIAEFTGSTRQNVKQMLLPLERKDFVTVNKSSNDRRALSVSLTQKCLSYFEKNEKSGDQVLDVLFSQIETTALEYTISVFQILFKNIEAFGK